MSDEINERLAEALTAAVGSDAVLTVESEHDPACPGGGDYCASHCPVPVQVVVEPDTLVERVAAALRPTVDALLAEARREADDQRAAKKIAADSADRFRDVLSECLGHPDENPGDDVLVAELREHFGKTGPEPTRWRDFITGALAMVDQINADRAALVTEDPA